MRSSWKCSRPNRGVERDIDEVLAGLSGYDLRKQLNDYQTGYRSNAVVQPVDKSTSPQQIAEAAA